jgi:hypothetical protein
MVKFYAQTRAKPLIDSLELEGSSPPGVFIGRMGYPKVYVGPLIPPVMGDTEIFDTPEMWQGKTIDEIVSYRLQLVRGKFLTNVHNVEGGGKIVDTTRELAMADTSTVAEAEFTKKPVGRIVMDDEVQPFGPSAPLRQLDVSSIKVNQRIDKAYSDTDLKAKDAVLWLYDKGIQLSRIQKSFSVGAFGIGQNRKFVPTRWSITAVDSTISAEMMEKTREYPSINEYRVYEFDQLDNRWAVLMMPREWSYELIEAWYPKTIWNPDGTEISMISSHEFYEGRTTYAEIGGCYYAARLATNELLNAEARQAGVVILREAHPGYIMPVGVWNVREAVRAALKQQPSKFPTLKEALDYAMKKMDISLDVWIKNSAVLKRALYQKRLSDYF